MPPLLKKVIGIPSWHIEDFSGTGSFLRVFLEHLYLLKTFKFLIISHRVSYELLDINKLNGKNSTIITLFKLKNESQAQWLKRAYQIFLKKEVDLIFYSSPLIYTEKNKPLPFFSLIHDVMNITLKEYVYNPFKFFREKKILKKNYLAERIITVSQFSKSEVLKKLSIDREKISVIYNAVFFKKDKAKLKKRKYILYVGDLRKRKNVFNLVLAYLELEDSLLEEYSLYLTGVGCLLKKIKKFAEKKKQLSRINFLGQVNNKELVSLYQQATLLAFPSTFEGFGLPVIEAQRNKLPVICGKHSSLREITAGSAFYADVNLVSDLKKKMSILLKNEILRKKYQKKGYENSKRFTPLKMMRGYESVFKNFLD